MSNEITHERIIDISRKLNLYDESLSIEELKGLALDKIEQIARGKDSKWKMENKEIIDFFSDYCLTSF